EDMEEFSLAPLCYMIVAENHPSEAFIEPLIQFLSNEDASELEIECEQVAYLVGKLCEALPEVAVPKFLDAIERLAKSETDATYSYLYDALYFADAESYKDQMLNIFREPSLADPDIFAQILAAKKIPEALPLMEERLKMMEQEVAENEEEMDEEEMEDLEVMEEELDALIEEIKRGEFDFSTLAQPWVQQRPDWKEYLQAIEEEDFDLFGDMDEDDFEDDDEYLAAPDELNTPHDHDYLPFEDVPETVKREHPKVGRNEPCPCGSGKKFKDCHWGKGVYD
ncbi:MAG: SEC-C metal-binding domain-containing protein, partial [Bacteroidota bacterium]